MGYSVSVNFKNEKQKIDVVEFINENKATINNIVHLSFLGDVRLPYFKIEEYAENENIPYGPKVKNVIGWKERGIPKGLYAVVTWLSHKVGNDYYYYDDEKFKIVTKEIYDVNEKEAQVNSKGFLFKEEIMLDKGMMSKMMQYLAQEKKQYKILISSLDSLEKNWNLQFSQEIKPKKLKM